jgi:hypothetical protein
VESRLERRVAIAGGRGEEGTAVGVGERGGGAAVIEIERAQICMSVRHRKLLNSNAGKCCPPKSNWCCFGCGNRRKELEV